MKKKLKNPMDLVAEVLDLDVTLLSENSTFGETPNWDSLNHVIIIGQIETCYEITIPDNEIENYFTLKAIIELHSQLENS